VCLYNKRCDTRSSTKPRKKSYPARSIQQKLVLRLRCIPRAPNEQGSKPVDKHLGALISLCSRPPPGPLSEQSRYTDIGGVSPVLFKLQARQTEIEAQQYQENSPQMNPRIEIGSRIRSRLSPPTLSHCRSTSKTQIQKHTIFV